jgi:hypothetical protein
MNSLIVRQARDDVFKNSAATLTVLELQEVEAGEGTLTDAAWRWLRATAIAPDIHSSRHRRMIWFVGCRHYVNHVRNRGLLRKV